MSTPPAFYPTPAWAYELAAEGRVSFLAFRLIGVLALYLRSSDVAWPSRRTLAEHLGCREDSIKAAVREGRDAGWLEVTPGCGRGVLSVYRLVAPKRLHVDGPVDAPVDALAESSPNPREDSAKGGEGAPPSRRGKGGEASAKRGGDGQFAPLSGKERVGSRKGAPRRVSPPPTSSKSSDPELEAFREWFGDQVAGAEGTGVRPPWIAGKDVTAYLTWCRAIGAKRGEHQYAIVKRTWFAYWDAETGGTVDGRIPWALLRSPAAWLNDEDAA